jgi:hypothetical protein
MSAFRLVCVALVNLMMRGCIGLPGPVFAPDWEMPAPGWSPRRLVERAARSPAYFLMPRRLINSAYLSVSFRFR